MDFYIGLKPVPCRAVLDSKALRSLRHHPGRIVRVQRQFSTLTHTADISIPGGRQPFPCPITEELPVIRPIGVGQVLSVSPDYNSFAQYRRR